MTKAQQKIDKKLREEWMAKGKDQYKISKGKLVLRGPTV